MVVDDASEDLDAAVSAVDDRFAPEIGGLERRR